MTKSESLTALKVLQKLLGNQSASKPNRMVGNEERDDEATSTLRNVPSV